MENSEYFKTYASGFRSGYLEAVQDATSAILRTINQHPRWMLPADREKAKACIRMAAEREAKKRGYVPSSYDVMRGMAEPVVLDFNRDI